MSKKIMIKKCAERNESKFMQNSKLKNSIVLRGMASNIVDEAIVILKPNIKIKKMEVAKNPQLHEKDTSKNFILKEAEHVILEYMNKINEKDYNSSIKNMKSKIKKLRIINVMFFILLIISILLK